MHNLPPHFSYVSTLPKPDITQKLKSYVVFLSVVCLWEEPVLVCLKWLWTGCVDKSQQVFKFQSDVPLPLHMHAAIFATGFVDDALSNTIPSVNEPLLLIVNAVFRLCVMSGSVET